MTRLRLAYRLVRLASLALVPIGLCASVLLVRIACIVLGSEPASVSVGTIITVSLLLIVLLYAFVYTPFELTRSLSTRGLDGFAVQVSTTMLFLLAILKVNLPGALTLVLLAGLFVALRVGLRAVFYSHGDGDP